MGLKRVVRAAHDQPGARRSMSMTLACLSLLAGCVLFCSASAQALTVQTFAGSFGSQGSGAGQFKEPVSIAVNDTTHDVYVVDSANNRVEEFNSTGSTLLREFNGSAAPTGAFSHPTQVAVDNSSNPLDPSAGDVYVVDSSHKVVDKFTEDGVYEGQLTGTTSKAFGALSGVAVDPDGVVWIIQTEGDIDSFNDALANEYLSVRRTAFGRGLHEGLAVDAEDNLYLNQRLIAKVNSSGETLINPIDAEDENQPGVAVDPSSKEVYIDAISSIAAFGLSGTPITRFGAGHLSEGEGVAVDASNGTVYATDRSSSSVAIFEAVVLPSVSIDAVSNQQPRSVTLNGTVTPDGMPVTSCVFEYGPTSAYGQSAPCAPASLGSGSSPVAVSASITGLTPESTYHYRLVAANANESLAGSTQSPDQQFTPGPGLDSESVGDVASSSATLQAQINPNGDDTHYYFEYGTTASYGTSVPLPAPGVDLGSGSEEQSVDVHLQNLAPATEYHYRVVAVQGGETFTGSDGAFTTQRAGAGAGVGAGATLADGRSWELVSPPNKKGALIEPFTDFSLPIQAASDGSGITYLSLGPAVGEDPTGRSIVSNVLSKRRSGGWESIDISLPRRNVEEGQSAKELVPDIGGGVYYLFSSNLGLAANEPTLNGTPLLSPEATERTPYLRDDENGSFVPFVTAANVPEGTKFGGEELVARLEAGNVVEFVAGTPDLSHVIVSSPFALTPEASVTLLPSCNEQCGLRNLFEWSNGELKLVNILPDGEATSGGAKKAEAEGPNLAGEHSEVGGAARAFSTNGRWIAWTWGSPYTTAKAEVKLYAGLYVRDMVEGTTVQVGGANARYQDMSSDGSRIFFLENGELYAFDTATDTQADLTATHGSGEASAGVQESVSDVNEDGSYVYFVAHGVLANGGVSGQDNLYLLHESEGQWSTQFIAELSSEDVKSWYEESPEGSPDLSGVSSRVSPNGRYLAFMSARPLTGYDNADAVSGKPDEEVYLYDSLTSRLICASCDPTGARPVGIFDEGSLVDRDNTWGRSPHWLAGSIPTWDFRSNGAGLYQPRFLSDGERLFFESPDALVPRDTNGLEDVYEYEPPAGPATATSDSCTTASATFDARSEGCVSLISSGTSSEESTFYDASENGDDAFFLTASKLVAADYDTSFDVYDAHACSSEVPCVAEPVSPPPCTSGDSCKAAPSPQPEIFGPTPSATFSGAGNVVEEATSAIKHKASHKAMKDKSKKRVKQKKSKARRARKARSERASGKGGKR